MGARCRLHVGGTFEHQLGQVNLLQLGFATLVQASKGQQILHKAGHTFGLRINTRQGGLAGFGERLSPTEHIGVPLNGGKGRAQLVGSVRNKGANLMFGAFAHLQGGVHVIK